MRNLIIPTCFMLLTFHLSINAQPSNFQAPVSINEDGTTPDKNAMLDIQSTNKGLLIPRMPYCDIEQISDATEGLMIYDTEFHCLRIYIQGRWHCLYQKLDGPNAELNVSGWANPTFDEDFNTSIAVDSKENVLVTMVTEDDEIRLTKFDNKGNILWTIFEGSGSKHGSVAVDLNDYIFTIAAPDRDDQISFNGVTSNDAGNFITKTSPDGSDTKIYTLPNSNISDLAIDNEGNVSFVFTFNEKITFKGITHFDDPADNIRKTGIAKLDNDLSELWIEVLDVFVDSPLAFQFGSNAIDLDEDGNIYLIGRHDNGVGHTQLDLQEMKANNLFTAKLNASGGKPVWTKNYGTDLEIYSYDLKYTDLYTGGNVFVIVVETNNTSFFPPEISDGILLNYNANSGNGPSKNKFSENVYTANFSVNNVRDEVAITFVSTSSNYYNTAPTKLLIYDYSKLKSPKKTIHQSFFKPGALTFNQDGSKIYGIAEGKIAGNVTIKQEPYSEDHIIYKVYNE